MPSITRTRRDAGLELTLWPGAPYEGRAQLDLAVTGPKRHRFTALTFGFGGEEEDASLHVGLYWVSFWLTLRGVIPWSWRRATRAWAERRIERWKAEGAGRRPTWAHEIDPLGGRDTGVRIFGGSVWWSLWEWRGGWSSGANKVAPWDSTGWTSTWHVVDWLLGATKHEREQLDRTSVTFTMPEGYGYEAAEHQAEVVTERRQWWRPRWPWGRVDNIIVEVTVEGGVPHPGKGTTAYNCDEDALITASTVVDETPWGQAPMLGTADRPLDTDELHQWQQAGIQHFIESATEYRRRYPL